MDRKTFLKKASGVVLVAIPTYTIVACSSDGSDDDDPTGGGGGQVNCLDNGTNSSIGSNHGHSLTVSKGDVTTGAEKTYAIQGSSGHPHSVTITAANFTTLKSNQNITVTSTANSGHTHSVTVSCA